MREASGSASNMKASNLTAFGASGWGSSTVGTRLSARWNGRGASPVASRVANARSRQCTPVLPAQYISRPRSSRAASRSAGRSLYSTSPARPSTVAITPMRSSGDSLATTIVDISARASRCAPIISGSAGRISGLSTWKVMSTSMPRSSRSPRMAAWPIARKSPPWPSGESARRSGAARRMSPLTGSTAGSMPCTNVVTVSGGRPNIRCSSRKARVAASLTSDVMRYHGRSHP